MLVSTRLLSSPRGVRVHYHGSLYILLKVMTVIRPVVLAFVIGFRLQAIVSVWRYADQWLKSLPKPVFKTNHNLLHLARWWTISSNCNVELAKIGAALI